MSVTKNPFFILVGLTPHSTLTFGIVTGNKSRPAFKIPPPTTIIGALSYPFSIIKGYPESSSDYIPVLLSSILEGVYVRFDGPIILYATITKMFFYKVREKMIKSDAYGYQRLYTRAKWGNESIIKLVYIFNPEKAEKARDKLGDKWKEKLIASAYSIIRLGDKESLVSVDNVQYGDVEILEVKETETSYTVPLTQQVDLYPIKGDLEVYEFYDWRELKGPRLTGLPTVKVALAYDPKLFIMQTTKVSSKKGMLRVYRIRPGQKEEYLVVW